MNLSIDASEIKVLAVSQLLRKAHATERINAVTRHYGQILQTRVMANASGRPGPRAVTGNYRRSIGLDIGPSMATVFSNAPQARRLELGFAGQDSLGRHYADPPRPHYGPALDEVGPLYAEALVAALSE